MPRWAWARLRTWRNRYLLSHFVPYQTEHTYAGVRLKVHIADPLAKGWYDHNWEALPEIDLLRTDGLRPGARVFDLGAHQAVVAMILAHHVGPTGEVVAVEPLPHNVTVGEINAALNGLVQVKMCGAAVADRPGEVEVCLDLNAQVKNTRTNIGTVRVPAVTIDELAERYGPPDALFIDVEGYECHALRGAARTLARRPPCYVEVHGGCGLELAGGSVEELFRLLPLAGYSFLAWPPNDQVPKP